MKGPQDTEAWQGVRHSGSSHHCSEEEASSGRGVLGVNGMGHDGLKPRSPRGPRNKERQNGSDTYTTLINENPPPI